MGREILLLDELDPQINLDDAPQTAYSQPLDRGLLCEKSCGAAVSLESMEEALLFQSIQGQRAFARGSGAHP